MREDKINSILPVPAGERNGRSLPVPAEVYRTPAYAWEQEPEEPAVPLSHYLWILKRHCWKVLSFIVFCVAATAIVSQRVTPVYEATATIDIDRETPPGVIGQDSVRNAINDADQFLATQIRLIQSDSVLRPVAQKYRLLDWENQADGEQRQFDAARVENAPINLKRLKVVRPPNTYLLLISYRSADPQLCADVSNAIANSYLEHTYLIRIRSSSSLSTFMEKQLEELKAKMEGSSLKLAQFERELNVINPEEKTNILSSRLLQLNTEYTNAQADRVRREAAYNSVKSGTLEAAQVSTQGESLKKLVDQLDEVQQKFADVKAHYGANHPEYKKAAVQVAEVQQQLQRAKENIGRRVEVEYREAANRELMLRRTVAETKSEFDRVNARSFEYQALKREAEADKKLYEELVRKIKEAGINAGFQNSAIRLADSARPPVKPVFPNLKLNLVLAFLFSSLLSVAAAVLTDVLDNKVGGSEQIARTLGTEVVGTLPLVKDARTALASVSLSGTAAGEALVPAGKAPDRTMTGFDEAIRTLRNSILLADFDRRLRSLMVTSASPSEGKSTIAVYLAIAHAQQGRKTLLIDGDLRRPSVHRRFDLSTAAGLSTTLNAETPWREALTRPEQHPNLDILVAGPASRRAVDQIGSQLPRIVEEASREYDLVVLDSPPLLGFPEPLQMAACVDGVLVVALAGRTDRKALGMAINTLKRLRANVVGVVLNEVKAGHGEYYYHYYHSKYYKHYHADMAG